MRPRRSRPGSAGVTFDTPFGRSTYRTQDHQSTFGAFVGKTALKGGAGVMVDWRYVDGSDRAAVGCRGSQAAARRMTPGTMSVPARSIC